MWGDDTLISLNVFGPFWPLDAKSRLTGKDPDAGKESRHEEKMITEDEMVGWHHWLNGHEFEQTPVDGEGQKHGVLQYVELQRVGHNLVTEQEIIVWASQVAQW